MEDLITLFRTEFPEEAMEIQVCIDLLNQSISNSVGRIKGTIAEAIDRKDYDKSNKMLELLKGIDEMFHQLESYLNMLQADDIVAENIVRNEAEKERNSLQRSDYEMLKVDATVPYSLYENFTHKRPAGFELHGERYKAKDWKEMLLKTCAVLAAKDSEMFNSFVGDPSMQGRKMLYFSNTSKGLRSPCKVDGTDIYIMTNMSANSIRNVIEKMLRKYKIKTSEYKVYLRVDYTNLHK